MHSQHSREEIAFAQALLAEIKKGLITSPQELEQRRFFWSKKCKLREMPSFPFVLAQAKKPTKKMKELLSVKPTRSLSGVQVIAVMLPPFPCPGECTYCPVALDTNRAPKSYTGYEPSALRAQRLGYDSYKIVENRIKQLDLTGNNADKIELVFQGSTFTAMPAKQQEVLVKKSIDAVLGKVTPSFVTCKLRAETAKRRVVGITFETRPDYCSQEQIKQMLSLGGTRVELGVQIPDDEVYQKIKRGHSVQDVVLATERLKDSASKVLYHLMPGLPGSSPKNDIKQFRKIFQNPDFRPDMVKFYPCLVIKGTELYEDWKKGDFSPMDAPTAAKVLAKIKAEVPKWVRVMRVNRDIPTTVISSGVMHSNLRQLVEKELTKMHKECHCIRCREVGLRERDKKEVHAAQAKIGTEYYSASKGDEAFISVESPEALFGFVRLRKPHAPFMKEITQRTALIRELHVYGKALPVGGKSDLSPQHQGIGKELMYEAERIAREEFDANKVVVISGLGVKEYYRKNFGYKKEGTYVSKKI